MKKLEKYLITNKTEIFNIKMGPLGTHLKATITPLSNSLWRTINLYIWIVAFFMNINNKEMIIV